MVTHVECFASWAACFAAVAGSVFSECTRSGADGRTRFTGFGEDMSTSRGWSSNKEATKSQLNAIWLGCWVQKEL